MSNTEKEQILEQVYWINEKTKAMLAGRVQMNSWDVFSRDGWEFEYGSGFSRQVENGDVIQKIYKTPQNFLAVRTYVSDLGYSTTLISVDKKGEILTKDNTVLSVTHADLFLMLLSLNQALASFEDDQNLSPTTLLLLNSV